LPPSVVVNELLDAIDATAHMADGRARQRIVQRHALQPFSPRYFGRDPEGRAFSYAATHYAGAAALVGPRHATPAVLTAPLPAPPLTAIALDDLVRFFEHPSRWFLQKGLGVYLGRDAELLAEREPIALDDLERWRIGDTLLQRATRGDAVDAAWPALRAEGLLPLGTPGRCAYDDVAPRAVALAGAAAAAR